MEQRYQMCEAYVDKIGLKEGDVNIFYLDGQNYFYLGVECEVNLIIKSQFGFTNEISYVLPFFYHVRYFHSQI